MIKYTPVVGLEVHVELKTKSKMFCSCSTDIFGKDPNTRVCPVCLGLPGALPVPNKLAIDWCIKIALALNCKINKFSKFDRKNYYYPDLAKGYQISQYDLPFGYDGSIDLPKGKIVRIRRVHMEEDTGKLSHVTVNSEKSSLVDFNRSGIPLVEVVTEPDFHDAQSVVTYLQKLHRIVRYLDVSNADMEKGEMRLEPNISLTVNIDQLPDYKVEIKNINSYKFVEKAINYETVRQTAILDKKDKPAQETRGWDEVRQKTFSQRSKEDAQDYRYFPEPDIPPIIINDSKLIDLKKSLPEFQDAKIKRFVKDYKIPEYDAEILSREIELANFFENSVLLGNKDNLTARDIANVIINKKIDHDKIDAKELITNILSQSKTLDISDQELEKLILEVINENSKAVEDFKNGKEASLMFMLGQVMKKSKVKIDVKIIKDSLLKHLKS